MESTITRSYLADLATAYLREGGDPAPAPHVPRALLMAARDVDGIEYTDEDVTLLAEILAAMVADSADEDRATGRGWAEAEWEALGEREDIDRQACEWTAHDLSGLDYTSSEAVRSAAAERWSELQAEARRAEEG